MQRLRFAIKEIEIGDVYEGLMHLTIIRSGLIRDRGGERCWLNIHKSVGGHNEKNTPLPAVAGTQSIAKHN